MNKLEAIAMKKLLDELFEALDRTHEKNADRIAHERPFIRGNIERAIAAARAIDEASENQTFYSKK